MFLQCQDYYLVTSALFANFVYIEGHTINNTYTLLQNKLEIYNKVVRPTVNQSEPTVVKFNFELNYIKEFDEVQQTLKVIGSFRMSWTDEMMKWDPIDYGGMDTLLAESGSFWTPSLVLQNTADKMEKMGDSWQTIRFSADGSANYLVFVLLTSTCSADVSLYPWDFHQCVLKLIPLGHTPAEMFVEPVRDKVRTTDFIDNGLWTLKDTQVKAIYSRYYSYVEIHLVLERKPLYVIVNVLVPLLFLSLLNILVFLLPGEYEDRLGYCITVLLAIAVFLTIVGDTLPKTSTPVSYFSYLLVTMLSASILIILGTIFNLNVYYTEESKEVTGCWATLATCCSRREKKRKNTSQTNGQNDKLYNVHTRTNNIVYRYNHCSVPRAPEGNVRLKIPGIYLPQKIDTQCMHGAQKEDKQVESRKQISWKSVSATIDKILFVFFLTIIIATAVVFSIVISNSNRNVNLEQ